MKVETARESKIIKSGKGKRSQIMKLSVASGAGKVRSVSKQKGREKPVDTKSGNNSARKPR